MSMKTLQLMSAHIAREDAMLDAALASFKVKDLPAFKDFKIKSVTKAKDELAIEGEWKDGRAVNKFWATVTIDTKTGKGIITGNEWLGTCAATAKGPLTAADRKTVVRLAHALVDDGAVAASKEARAAIAILKTRR